MDDSSSLSLEPLTPVPAARGDAEGGVLSPLVQCVVCSKPLQHLRDDEREAHVNACLDGKPSPHASCSVCHRPLAHLDGEGRNAHVNRCMDEEARRAAPVTAASAVRAGENRMDGPSYFCVVCNKDLCLASVTARGQHVKSCAKKNKTDAAEMRSLANGESEAPRKTSAKEEVYRDPVSGFTRRLGPPAPSSSAQKNRRKAKQPADDDVMLVGDDEELAHIAIALAASLGGGVETSSSGGVAPAVGAAEKQAFPLRSLQHENTSRKHVDLAGFAVPSLTQVVNEVAPLPPPPPPSSSAPAPAASERPQLPATRLGNSTKSLWKKASERPNAEAGAYNSLERTPLLPPTPAAAAAVAATPEVTPFKRQRLEIPARAEEEVRHELANISNAYTRACGEALAGAKASVDRTRLEYFAAIGGAAVVRDTAIEALLARHLLHEGHASALPLGSYAAAPFPEPRLKLAPEAPAPEVVVVREKRREEEVEEDEDRMLLLAGCADVEGVPSPPKKPRIAVPEVESSPILRGAGAVSGTLDTPAGGAPPPPVLPPTPPHLTPQAAAAEDSDSQPPRWEDMGVEELKSRMATFGLQAGTEKFMRQRLAEIWDYVKGKRVTESLLIAKQLQSREVPDGDVVTPVRPMAKLADAGAEKNVVVEAVAAVVAVEAEADEGDLEDDPVGAAEAQGPGAAWEEQVLIFIKRGAYWERMLLFEPIQLQQLLEDIRHAKVAKLSRQTLAAFLDRKGVVYDDAQSKWNR